MFFTPTAYYKPTASPVIPNDYYSDLVAWYNFNGNANDSINGYNGVTSSMSFTNTGITETAPPDYSATFNGTNSYITVADNDDLSFGEGAFSINFWIKKSATKKGAYIFTKRSGTGGSDPLEYQMDIDIVDVNTIRLFIFPIGSRTTYFVIGNNTPIPTDTWTMITFTYLGFTLGSFSYNNLNCYVNGIDNSAGGVEGTVNTGMANTTAPVVFGRQGDVNNAYFDGQLDQFRVWKGRALNASEVLGIYNNKI